MRIGRMLSPVHSLGPGERVCLWTQGCSKCCKGCISPELQGFKGTEIKENALCELIKKIADKNNCTGLTISGGDPMEQSDSLLKLLGGVRDRFDDILVYTGFDLEEIKEGKAGDSGIRCLEFIDVLIDGRYVRELNRTDCVLRGSSNQIVHFLSGDKKSIYEEYMRKGRIVETFVHNDKTIVTGILNEVKFHE